MSDLNRVEQIVLADLASSKSRYLQPNLRSRKLGVDNFAYKQAAERLRNFGYITIKSEKIILPVGFLPCEVFSVVHQ
jgi:hypothetical protein